MSITISITGEAHLAYSEKVLGIIEKNDLLKIQQTARELNLCMILTIDPVELTIFNRPGKNRLLEELKLLRQIPDFNKEALDLLEFAAAKTELGDYILCKCNE